MLCSSIKRVTTEFGNLVVRLEGCDFSRDEDRANARLIAAAPDLLAALETLVEHFEESHAPELESDHQGDGPHGCTYCESIPAARAAIANAKGEG